MSTRGILLVESNAQMWLNIYAKCAHLQMIRDLNAAIRHGLARGLTFWASLVA